MRLIPIVILAVILAASIVSVSYYYANNLNNHNIQGSSASNGSSSSHNNNNNSNNHDCLNGTTDYPSCSSCPTGQSLTGNHCTSKTKAGNVPICMNGATDQGICLDCPNGQALINNSCINNCSNGDVNPPYCDNSTGNCHDPDNIQPHLYSPDRLTVIIPCVTVTGTVGQNGGVDYNNNDGDTIVGLLVDSQYSWLINSGDQQYISGHLQSEIICSYLNGQVPRECSGYTSHVLVPNEKQHVMMTGPYVKDTNHNNWGEIHPVYSITVTPVHNSTITENLYVQYPNYESNGWLGPHSSSHLKTVTMRDGLLLVDNFTLSNPSTSSQQINDIYLDTTDFTIHSISQHSPINFGPGQTITIVLVIDTPYWYYTGPLNIHFVVSGP